MELICPNCKQPFAIDDVHYASLLSQVKNKEFDAEIKRRMEELHQKFLSEQKASNLETESKHQAEITAKDNVINEKINEITKLKEQVNNAANAKELELNGTIAEKDNEIIRLKELLKRQEEIKNFEVESAKNNKEQEILRLKGELSQKDSEKQLAIFQEKTKAQQELQAKDAEIINLNNRIQIVKNEAQLQASTKQKEFEIQLNAAKDEIERIKDFKAKLSTKMIGESLEIHCSQEFNKVRTMMYPNAYFEKDNDASGGSKGDFIFRDFADGQEYISIMFEMKNESDDTQNKHKNEDFFTKLDKDRKEKNCEYAVLVSMLDPGNELYNGGIVDVSYRYPKMFVIRPQFFMPLIALLTQASRKTIDLKRELEIAKSQSIDVTNFEAKVAKFKDAFSKNVGQAVKNHDEAISRIDSAIKSLQTIKELFEKSNKYLESADKKLEEDFTVRKLTYNNPTMKAKFEEAKQLSENNAEDF